LVLFNAEAKFKAGAEVVLGLRTGFLSCPLEALEGGLVVAVYVEEVGAEEVNCEDVAAKKLLLKVSRCFE